MRVSLSLFLHLGSFHYPPSYTLSSYVFQRDPSSTHYISYVYGANPFTMNLASTTWAIFTLLHSLVHSNDICIGSATNNQDKYDVVIRFLGDVLDRHILHLHACLDSLLLVMQLNELIMCIIMPYLENIYELSFWHVNLNPFHLIMFLEIKITM